MVGGMVRDILLNRPVHDIDLSFCGNVREYGKKVADDLGAAFFMLNEKFQTARIIYKSRPGIKRWIDIVATRNNDILMDLSQRDFTINAMAIEINKRESLIDPLSGANDLNLKILKLCIPDGLAIDPVRILRAVRLSVQFGWKISPETIQAMKISAPRLNLISVERKRDEIFRILNLENPVIALRILIHLNLVKYSFPEIDFQMVLEDNQNDETQTAWDQSISNIQKFIQFEKLVFGGFSSEGAMNIRQAVILMSFRRFRLPLTDYFQIKLHEDRPIRSLFMLAFLYHNYFEKYNLRKKSMEVPNNIVEDAISLVEKIARALVLSNLEVGWLKDFSNNIYIIQQAIVTDQPLNPEFAYDFFYQSKLSGVAICLYSLMNRFDIEKDFPEDKNWMNCLSICSFLVDAYFNHFDEWIHPPNFINGHDIMKILGIKDGKIIGYWINKITLESVKGKINSHSDAVRFLKKEANKAT
ncbi:MAG: hypothetical protein Q7U53_04535 [Anaerolineaceae bacterium]|nr:hypothetical protein [Anaerolineaceae bacterium]